MTPRRSGRALFGLLLVLVAESSAWADPSPAESLYREGRSLFLAGRYAEACPKLASSQALEPATGTLLNLASCHEKEGKLATALGEFMSARARAVNDQRPDRVKFAEERIESLGARTSRIRVEVPPPGNEVSVSMDGTPLAREELGRARPADVGEHHVNARDGGGHTFEERIVVAAEGDLAVVRVRFPPVEPTRGPPPAPPESRASIAPSLVVLGVGVLATGVGSYFGIRSYGAWDDRNAGCGAGGCNADGLAAGERAQDFALGANIGFGVGIVTLATGVYLLVHQLSKGPRR